MYKIRLIHGPAYKKNVSFRRMINHIIVARKFSRFALSEPKPDIILCSLPTLELSNAAVEYGVYTGVPVVLDVRDLWPDAIYSAVPRGIGWLARIMLRGSVRKMRHALKKCSAITGVSESYLNWALDYAERQRRARDSVFHLSYQLNGVNENEKTAALNALIDGGVDPNKTICWFIGGFGRTYNIETVIDAARRLESEGRTDIQFVLCGEGERGTEWRTMASGLKNVVFTGWIGPPSIAALMDISDIGLAAYAKCAPQGIPNKIFEYMSAGLPILSSLRGETETLIGHYGCGFTYSSSDSIDLVDKLDELLKDSALMTQMGLNSKKLFNEKFAAKSTYSRMAKFLEDLASGK